MTAGVPWSVSAVDPDTWDAAREAARKAGVSVGEWLESAIRENAQHVKSRGRSGQPGTEIRLEDLYERIDQLMRRDDRAPAPRAPAADPYVTSLDALTGRIDTLLRGMDRGHRDDRSEGQIEVANAIRKLDARIESFFSAQERTRAPERAPYSDLESKLDDIAETVENLGKRLDRELTEARAPSIAPTAYELDEAVADIIERQAALDGVAPRRAARIAPEAPVPSNLENRLKHIADEMESLRRSSSRSEAINELRRDIADLSRTMADLAPKRTLDAVESTVEALARRIDRAPAPESGDNGAVLAALDDIRDALAAVRPAESFASVEGDLNALSNKLDVLNAKSIDGTTVARIQNQIADLRELLANALPTDALQNLVGQIETMAGRVERATATDTDNGVRDVVSALERRIDALAERISSTTHEPAFGNDALERINSRLDSLQGALDGIEIPNPMGLEDTMRSVVERLDASEAKLAGLGTIERGISDLSDQFDQARTNAMEVAERAAKTALRELQAARLGMPQQQPAPPPQHPQSPSIVPAAPAPERPLAGESMPPAPPPQIRGITQVTPPVEPVEEPQPRFTRTPVPVAPRGSEAVATDGLPADYPLEPGSGAPRSRPVPVSQRIAQSEAALADITPKPSESAPRTSDYIAAARRAAQAAAAESVDEETAGKRAGKPNAIAGIFSRGRRAILLGLAVTLIGFSAVRFFGPGLIPDFFGSSTAPAPAPVKPAPQSAPAPEKPAPETQATPQTFETVPAPNQRSMLPLTDPTAGIAPASGILAPNVTGSILSLTPDQSLTTQSSPPRKTQASLDPNPAPAPDLPEQIGNPALRAAAASGDPDAAFEIAERYLAGRGVKADPAKALQWFERAAAKGSALAAFRLGMAYEKGIGVTKDRDTARKYYVFAAEAGHIKAMHNLAVMTVEVPGKDGKADYAAAIPHFRNAAEHGLRDSQYNLGVLYARGLGVAQNLTESFRWFSLAANQGDADAAKKRDDVAARLDHQTLVAAKLAVQTWKAKPADDNANLARLKPEWQKTADAPKKKKRKK